MKLLYIFISSILFSCFICSPGQGQGININDLKFKTGTIKNYDTGEFESGKLEKPSRVGGFLCKNVLVLYKSGKIKECKLAEEIELIKIKFPKNTCLFFNEDGILDYCWLGKNTTIQGYPCKGGQKTQTTFHPKGKIQCCFLSRPFKIEGIYCKATHLAPVCFFADGRLKECTTEVDQEVKGRFVKAGSKLLF